MTEAYRSAVELSFDVRAGLVMRQIHHWAALLFIAAIVVHLMRIFFTGAFRRPRELNWMVGVTLLVLAIFNGFAGYSLLDDQLSGTGLRIAYSITLSIPLAGTWLASLLFGGEFPGPDIINRLYVIHILLLPALIAALIGAHLVLVVRHKHTQFAGKGRDRGQRGRRARCGRASPSSRSGSCCSSPRLLAALGGLAQINPIWLYGPFDPAEVSSASQPDWYMGWLDGALRLFPPWEIRAFGYEVPAPVLPRRAAGRHHLRAAVRVAVPRGAVHRRPRPHHLLDRPRDRPVRTSLGVATLSFYAVLTLAALERRDRHHLRPVGQRGRRRRSASLSVVLPPIAAGVTYRLCHELQARDIANGIQPPERPRIRTELLRFWEWRRRDVPPATD